MNKVIKSTKGPHPATLVLHDADIAVVNLLKTKRQGKVTLTISHASVDEDTIFITQKGRILEFNRSDVFK